MDTLRYADVAWNEQLLDQLEWHWDHHLWPRFEQLSDDEYLWEPAPGCWSIRPRSEATTSMAAGAGDTVADFEDPEPQPAPLTTIAWRLAHIAVGIFGERAANHFGEPGSVTYPTTDWPLTAAGMRELLRHHHDAWVSGVKALGENGLAHPCGPAEGPFAEYPMAALVLHISREAIHHGSEVCLMGDFYRTTKGSNR